MQLGLRNRGSLLYVGQESTATGKARSASRSISLSLLSDRRRPFCRYCLIKDSHLVTVENENALFLSAIPPKSS